MSLFRVQYVPVYAIQPSAQVVVSLYLNERTLGALSITQLYDMAQSRADLFQ